MNAFDAVFLIGRNSARRRPSVDLGDAQECANDVYPRISARTVRGTRLSAVRRASGVRVKLPELSPQAGSGELYWVQDLTPGENGFPFCSRSFQPGMSAELPELPAGNVR